ncbi:ATP-binding protein [Moraxella osloensis]|jgi:predicted ATPase|nr:ATP-binding protein [Moraxella osloensis]QRO12614.1 ATP-binding protein [Moraxella osloensis]
MTENFSITIKNFKSYKEATLPLAPLTLLIGANASGKSNAIEAFRFLSWVAGGERLSTLKNRVNDSDKIIRGNVSDLPFRETEQFVLSFSADSSNYESIFNIRFNEIYFGFEIIETENENFIFTFDDVADDGIYVSQESLSNNFAIDENKTIFSIKNSDYSDVFNLSKELLSFFLKENGSPYKIEKIYNDINFLKSLILNAYFFDFVPSQMRYESLSEKDLRSNGQNLAGVLHYLCEKDRHASDNKTKLLNLIKSLPEQNIIDIKFYVDHRERVEFALIENFGNTPKEFPMDLLSDGTLKVLAIATALLSVSTGSTLVIEEIDNSIHPSRAHDILSLMRQYAEERGLKLLLSTHNPALMDAIPDEALADVVFCYRDPQQGDSRLVRLGDLDDYVGLVVQGSLGDLVKRGIVERFVKHPKTKEEKKKQALDWLKQMQVDSQ